MVDLESDQLCEVIRILSAIVPEYQVVAFGSRVAGNSRPFSDLDLVIMGNTPIEPETMQALREAFSASDLAIKVDVLDWQSISETFRQVISRGPKYVLQLAAKFSPSK